MFPYCCLKNEVDPLGTRDSCLNLETLRKSRWTRPWVSLKSSELSPLLQPLQVAPNRDDCFVSWRNNFRAALPSLARSARSGCIGRRMLRWSCVDSATPRWNKLSRRREELLSQLFGRKKLINTWPTCLKSLLTLPLDVNLLCIPFHHLVVTQQNRHRWFPSFSLQLTLIDGWKFIFSCNSSQIQTFQSFLKQKQIKLHSRSKASIQLASKTFKILLWSNLSRWCNPATIIRGMQIPEVPLNHFPRQNTNYFNPQAINLSSKTEHFITWHTFGVFMKRHTWMDGEEAKQNLITFWDHLRHGFGGGRDVTSQFRRDVYNQAVSKFRRRVQKHSSLSPAHIGFLMARTIAAEFMRSGIFVLSHFGDFIFETLSEVKLVILKEEKTFTDNICDELRKRRSSLKINPDDQISMWIHHGLRFLFVCKFITRAGSKNIWRSLNLEVNCAVHFASKKRRATKTRSVEQQTEQTFVNHDVIE